MFKRAANAKKTQAVFSTTPVWAFHMEGLEDRRLMSFGGFDGAGFGGGAFNFGGGDATAHNGRTIEFSQAPTVVQTGLKNLATTDNVTAPAATDTVELGNANGKETYSLDVTGTGTDTRLTVDVTGAPVTAPTRTTTTFGAINKAAVTGEITKIATALSLTAPTSSTTVHVLTNSDGTAVYSLHLANSSGTGFGRRIQVDQNGNPVGRQNLPLSVMPAAIQSALIAHAPSGVTLTSTSTDIVHVRTVDGVTLYTMVFDSTGTRTAITVNAAGALTSPPTRAKTDFSSIPTAAQNEIKTLATADGVTTTIATTQTVRSVAEPNGTTVYTVRLTDSSGNPVRITVDQAGNPTVPPNDRGGFGFAQGFAFGGGGSFGLGGLGGIFGGHDGGGGGGLGGFLRAFLRGL